ncbi:MAG: hypothetical protein AAGD07_05695 [Planctomycetota bacterium]
MAFGPLPDLIDAPVERLYEVYLQTMERDHAFRLQAIYGDQPVPEGFHELHPMSLDDFVKRVRNHESAPQYATGLRRQIARQAAAYGVDVNAIVTKTIPTRHAA